MYHYDDLHKILQEALNNQELVHEPRALYEPIEYSMHAGGKRLRPILLLMAVNLYSSDIHSAIMAALGIEMFHNFTLVHDDVMDKAEVRRNQATVHKKWNLNTALLSGDAMMIKAYDYIFKYKGSNAHHIYRLFNQAALRVCEGQQYDMDFEKMHRVTENEYLNMIKLKTAELVACSLEMGALIGGAEEHDSHMFSQFGRDLGIAFQLQDDYLDAFGDIQVFGKKIGGDIIAGKKTYLLIKALEVADKQGKDTLNQLLGNREIDPEEKVEKVRELYTQFNVQDLAARKIEEYFVRAMETLAKIPHPDQHKLYLQDLAGNVMGRQK